MAATKKSKNGSTSWWEREAAPVVEHDQPPEEHSDYRHLKSEKHPLAVCMIPMGNWAKHGALADCKAALKLMKVIAKG